MRILLDTQIFIWHAIQHPKLTVNIRRIIDEASNKIVLSHVSFFEIAIKQKIEKLLEFPLTIAELQQFSEERNFILLPITATHIAAYDRVN
jgi:PIN domain nuclease of toxin-antitoxin system